MARKPIYKERMKPNGLPKQVDSWFSKEAKKQNTTAMTLKREILVKYMNRVISNRKKEIKPNVS